MTEKQLRVAAVALAIAAGSFAAGPAGLLAQDYQGSVVTIGGGTSDVAGGNTVVVAPGVAIDGGDVVNETGIGVNSGGGASIGAATGGGTNAATVE